MSLHADVSVPARDRKRLERLCRYVARPPLALERLVELPDRRLAYRLKTPWRDGTTHVVMERRELLERLAPLIPPPRAHQVRYHGVLAPCASGRDRVVPGRTEGKEGRAPPATPTTRAVGVDDSGLAASLAEQVSNVDMAPCRAVDPRGGTVGGGGASPTNRLPGVPHHASAWTPMIGEERESAFHPVAAVDRRGRTAWAELLQRVFEVDALRCPACGSRMQILSVITEPDVARRILEWLDMPSRAPPLGKPKAEHDGVSPNEPRTDMPWEADSGFDFDQSIPGDG